MVSLSPGNLNWKIENTFYADNLFYTGKLFFNKVPIVADSIFQVASGLSLRQIIFISFNIFLNIYIYLKIYY